MKKIALLFVGVMLIAAGCKSVTQNQTPNTQTTQDVQQQAAAEQPLAYDGVEGKNALDLLKEKYTVETKHFSFGDMVVAINGKRVEDGKNFWAFYVNGQQANVGADQYVTKNGEKIEWKLEDIK